MKKFKATEAKNKFGEVLENSQREDIVIEKNGRESAVIMAMEEYKKLKVFEDHFWATKAEGAKKEGFIGEKESEDLLSELLNAKD